MTSANLCCSNATNYPPITNIATAMLMYSVQKKTKVRNLTLR